MRVRRGTWIAALFLAGAGAWLAGDAFVRGSLLRYRLVGYAIGAALSLPLVSLLLFRARAARVLRRVVFVGLPFLLASLLAEGVARLVLPAPPTPGRVLDDARLGHVMAPRTAECDSGGFRNAAAVDRAEVLFVGDSQTWGFGVAADEAMSQRFAQRTGARTYQMANGSYGPVQYRELLQRGLALRPRLVVVGFYFGNDLVDARDYAALQGAEDLRTPGQQYTLRPPPIEADSEAPNLAMTLVEATESASYLLHAGADLVRAKLRGTVLDDQPGAVWFDDESVPTILLPSYRAPLVDLALPHVADGAAITARCLSSMGAACRGADVLPLLLAIPTKEYCYATWAGDRLPELESMRRAEMAARAAVFAAADAAQIEVVDMMPALLRVMSAGERPWRRNGDGHLSARGHDLAAELLVAHWHR